jgi:pyruvate carboxylase
MLIACRLDCNVPFWPQELLEGRLGFPHRGFPPELQAAVLKGATPLPMGERSSTSLNAANFEHERDRLTAAHGGVCANTRAGRPFSDEDVCSSFLYPAVFKEYLEHVATYSAAGVGVLPTYAFW